MTIHLDPAAIDTAASTPSAPAGKPAVRLNARSAAAPAVPETRKELPPVAPIAGAQEANITFRRDANGRVYYVVTDPHSGSEIQQLPPEEVRHVGERIEEYLKQQANLTRRINVKG
jgi:hypothetical protein